MKDDYLIALLKNIGTKIRQYEFLQECNEVGLEYGAFEQDIDVKKIEINEEINKLVQHIKENY